MPQKFFGGKKKPVVDRNQNLQNIARHNSFLRYLSYFQDVLKRGWVRVLPPWEGV
jgi:hypothetical protein